MGDGGGGGGGGEGGGAWVLRAAGVGDVLDAEAGLAALVLV